ncbi:bifunctional diaminohydroxyphosphoribosylaminopyrimidine deaminase/5-amino-6-(5-phosphoribosylamino)uracil reductase RibD [Treponema sp. J25]|uniref:bifunctional diaminohydroxyphosphoribosylaminopyrimidine deaminase/5-amino-6-(5-phosphoribosylamino)uracil reductase RibD n=1 Tax=Treponema sp. J25 TaxID=2094121 RepID=UPI0014049CFC|nr:bifunctional diaminohydroxyphosphoribosylaminopyrimidine deaminase/5-amino-6-(5-phosphoribosylamino)uracil reductase RibD [Treponema sp. J25]
MHHRYMSLALELARKGAPDAYPNPLVGAVLVLQGEVIGTGYHARYGGPHAEIAAIEDAHQRGYRDLSQATLYVTLEPCCHYGKTPPCTERIIKERIGQVVIGTEDPCPLVCGKGIKALREAHIPLQVGVMKDQCRRLNPFFFTYHEKGRPYGLLKMACSLDGKIGWPSEDRDPPRAIPPNNQNGTHHDKGEPQSFSVIVPSRQTGSRWISGETSHHDVHRLRAHYQAILCGIGTVLADDPLLTTRLYPGKNPLRVIVDSQLRIPLTSRIVQSATQVPTIVATCASPEDPKAKALQERGIRVLSLPPMAKPQPDPEYVPEPHPATPGNSHGFPKQSKNPRTSPERVDLRELALHLGKEGITSLLIEGGSRIAASALAAGIVDRVRLYVAPFCIADPAAPSLPHPERGVPPEGNPPFPIPCLTNKAVPFYAKSPLSALLSRLTNITLSPCGEDIIIEGDPCSPVSSRK